MHARDVISRLGLKPLPGEGGFFRETYRAEGSTGTGGGPRPLMTTIYYLLTPGVCSRMHRLPSDEIWHHYAGGPVRMLILHPDGKSESPLLGSDIGEGERPQVRVPAGCWQGAILEGDEAFALMGTTVSPGFDFSDFEAANRESLDAGWPEHRELIALLTPGFIIPLT